MSKVQTLFVAAAISPLTAQAVGKAFAKATDKHNRASVTYLTEAMAAAALIGVPITSGQYDRQIAPSMRAAFKASRNTLTQSGAASALSRLKTFCLAVCTGQDAFQPVAGETFKSFLDRIAEPLAKAEHEPGKPVWDTVKQGKPAKAAGTRSSKSGTALPGAVASAGTAGDDEGGLNIRPALAAAMILCSGNAARAQRLCAVLSNYAEEFDRWTATILSDDDRAKLAKVTTEAKASATPPPVKVDAPDTAMAAALIQGQRKANAKRASK